MKSSLSAALFCIVLMSPMLSCDRDGDSSGSSDPSGALDPVDSARVAFVSFRDGNFEVYVARADGSNATRLTVDAGSDVYPAWSPDGTRIAFVSARDGDGDIFIMDSDGSSPTKLMNSPFVHRSPAWSPDSAEIVFVSSPAGTESLYLVNTDGSYDPKWQPVCNVSACERHDQGSGCQSVTDGGAVTDGTPCSYSDPAACAGFPYVCFQPSLTGSPFPTISPAWSPDGGLIAFVSNPTGTHEIYLINSDGSYETKWHPVCNVSACRTGDAEAGCLDAPDRAPCDYRDPKACNDFSYICFQPSLSPQDGADDLEPAWSPSGAQIAFRSNRDGNDEIYVMDSDGSNQVNLTNSQALEASPAWSADGARIAFTSSKRFEENLEAEVYVMDANGSNQVDISNAQGDDFGPTWSSD